MGIQVTVTGGTEENDRIPELMGRKRRLDQMTSTVLSFCRHLLSLAGKGTLRMLGLFVACAGRESPRGFISKAGCLEWLCD
jgi:hypothetical protein